jgi:hypothetical protein
VVSGSGNFRRQEGGDGVKNGAPGGLAPAGRDVRRNGTRWIDARTRPKRMEVERTTQGNFSLSKPYFYILYSRLILGIRGYKKLMGSFYSSDSIEKNETG